MKPVLLFVVALFVLTAHTTHAQLAFGPKAGLNFASIDFDDPDATYESRAGFNLGLFMRAKFDRVAIQPEVLLFTQRGESSAAFNLVDVKERFTYLSVPVMFKFYPFMGLNVQLGPQFGFLLDGEQEYETAFVTVKRDITEAYKETDIALAAGLGYDFEFGLGLDVRYNIGLKDINDAADGEEARSRVFVVSLGWNFLR